MPTREAENVPLRLVLVFRNGIAEAPSCERMSPSRRSDPPAAVTCSATDRPESVRTIEGVAMTDSLRSTDRGRVERLPARGHLEREVVDAILDEALVCHVAWADTDGPSCIPLLHARIGDHLYLHGSPAARLARVAQEGVEVCATITLIDGLVLARSAFHHSVNYRSVVLYGRLERVQDRAEKIAAFDALLDHTVPGRRGDCRPPDEDEIRRTAVMRLRIDEGSAKVRSGPPKDDEPDHALDHWAGVIPLRLARGVPEPAPDLRPDSAIPPYAH